MKGGERFRVIDGCVLHTATVMKRGMLRTDGGIIQTGGHGMCRYDLAVFILQNVRECSVENARPAPGEPRCMVAKPWTASTGFNPDHSDLFIRHEIVEQADRVAAAANAGDEHIGKPSFLLQDLGSHFAADDRLKIANHEWIRMRPENRAKHVIGCADVRYPIAHRFIDGVLQRLAARRNRHHAGSQQFHSEKVQFLAADVFLTHVDIALQAQQRADSRRRHTMLPGARFRDNSFLAHADGEQTLAKAVIYLVRSGVVQILAFEVNLCAAPGLREALGQIKRSRPARVIVEELIELCVKLGILLSRVVCSFELFQRMHERFGHELPAVISEVSFHGAPIIATSAR